jgi:shikimate dehydrogenase
MYKLAVVGNPIEHSLSPTVFRLFAKEFGVALTYDKLLAKDENDFKSIVQNFFLSGGLALNVTSPFKQIAFNVAKAATSRAMFCGAANFLYADDNGDVVADTTDGIGLVNDIQNNHKINLAKCNILIIGSGFVLDSILLDLIVINPKSIDLLARNVDRIEYLSNKFMVGEFSLDKEYDFILNTVPNNMENQLLEKLTSLQNSSVCYDMAYRDMNNNKFVNYVQEINPNIRVYSGIGMLVEQAAIAFTKLFNMVPNNEPIIKILREE